MSIGFRPLYDKILLKKIEQDQKTPGGIIIPDTAKEKPVSGEVLAVVFCHTFKNSLHHYAFGGIVKVFEDAMNGDSVFL